MPPGGDGRILDFDIETRRIGFHNAGRFAPDGCEPIAIAHKWVGERRDPVIWLQRPRWTRRHMRRMMEGFVGYYEQADIVTGHYIRKFDLPILNGVLMELGLAPLPPKWTIDTKLDLIESAGLSKSQENLSALLDLEASKFHMNDYRWREAARLTAKGLTDSFDRVRGDVLQHEQLYKALTAEGYLNTGRMWG